MQVYDCYQSQSNRRLLSKRQGRIKENYHSEDNFGNGLGAEVSSIVSADPSASAVVKQIFVKRMPKSGITAEDVLDFVGMGI